MRAVDEFLVRAVDGRDVEPLIPLPEVFPWLGVREAPQFLEEMVVLSRIPRIGLPVPDVVKLRMCQAEPLEAHVLVPVYLPILDLRIPSGKEPFAPKKRDGV